MLLASLRRGLAAGLVAGLAFGLFVAFVAGPLVGVAETASHHEEAADHESAGHDHGVTFVGVAVDVGAGLAWGGLAGLVTFGAAHYLLEPAIPGGPGVRSALLGGAGFLTVSGVPWLFVPPLPGTAETALGPDARLAVYAAAMVAGALACCCSGYAYGRLSSGRPHWIALVGAAVPFFALVGLAAATGAPSGGGDLPGSLLAAYRGVVVAGQVGFWAMLAGTHAAILARSDRERGPAAGFEQPSGPAATDA